MRTFNRAHVLACAYAHLWTCAYRVYICTYTHRYTFHQTWKCPTHYEWNLSRLCLCVCVKPHLTSHVRRTHAYTHAHACRVCVRVPARHIYTDIHAHYQSYVCVRDRGWHILSCAYRAHIHAHLQSCARTRTFEYTHVNHTSMLLYTSNLYIHK